MQDDQGYQDSQRLSLRHQVSPEDGPFLNRRPQCTKCSTQDGTVASFDMRTNAPIYRKMLHKGAVNSLKVVEEEGLLISCSASGSISVLGAPHFE